MDTKRKDRVIFQQEQDEIIAHAMEILKQRLRVPGELMTNPDTIRHYLTLKLADKEREHFGVILVDCQIRFITDEILFMGSLTTSNVHPREVVKLALAHNAYGVILYHNHPSGASAPSEMDKSVTHELTAILRKVDCSLLDHFIVAGEAVFTFSEHGLL